MYPKKIEFMQCTVGGHNLENCERNVKRKALSDGFNQCHEQFTQEIRERTEVEKLVEIISKEVNKKDERWYAQEREVIPTKGIYIDSLAQALQQHIRQGLGDKK